MNIEYMEEEEFERYIDDPYKESRIFKIKVIGTFVTIFFVLCGYYYYTQGRYGKRTITQTAETLNHINQMLDGMTYEKLKKVEDYIDMVSR